MSGAWNASKVNVFREEYLNFLRHVSINSKELGRVYLGDHRYRSQDIFLDGVFGGLAEDIHWFDILKSRQLGISTDARALTLFWAGVHDGLKGYMILDTEAHKEEARLELIDMIQGLPDYVKFPRIARQNRNLLQLENGTLINFASGGVRAGKTSGALGRGSGVNFCHVSEMCTIDNEAGIESFKNSLAEDFPNRLYLWESTARGFNQRWRMWEEAKIDSHVRCVFIGWWAKDNQIIRTSDPDFERYGVHPPSDAELKKIRAVKEQYGWQVTPEQLAWVRRKMDPTAKDEGDAPAEYVGNVLRLQEQPWTEDDAFQMSGATFFQPEYLTDIAKQTSNKFKTYSYTYGAEFVYCKIFPAHNARSIELKVWEEPDEDGIYVLAADVAFGANEHNDRSAIQVLRCYADGLDQVAEYAWPLVNSRQFAWVIMSLAAWYAGERASVYLIIELNGPGEATWNEIQSLKHSLTVGYQIKEADERGLRRIWNNVRHYIYNRSDSMSSGHNYQWKTTERLKVTIMERLRDFVTNRMLRIRSLATVMEMKSIQREGDSIAAAGTDKDDRVISLAMGVRCWEERVRKMMSAQRRTRESEAARKRLTIHDQFRMFNEAQLSSVFATKAKARKMMQIAQSREQWRRGRR